MNPAAAAPRVLGLEELRADVMAALDEPDDAVGDDDDLVQLGLDSIAMMRLAGRWHLAGADITFAELLQGRTLAQWWQLVSASVGGSASAVEPGPAGVGFGLDESASFALAPMQHAYWVGRADGRPLGGVGAHFYTEFDGRAVDPARLEGAVRAVLRRHGMLRAVVSDDGTQRVLPESSWPGPTVHDLQALPVGPLDERLNALRERLSHRRLRVERGEVVDIQLSLLPQGGTRLHVHIEMLVADAHSFRVLMSDLARAYQRPDADPAPIGLSYAGYRAAVARRPAPQLARDQEYWTQRLAELPGPPELPLAVEPAQVSGHRTARHHHVLDRADHARLCGRARKRGLTPSIVFLTAFAEVLAAWSVSPRFLLNLPIYDRQPVHPEVGDLIGDFTGLLPLEVDTSGPESFAERAAQVQEQFRADAAHVGYSGLDVIRDLTRLRGVPLGAPVVFTSALSLGELFDEQVRDCFGTPGWTMSQTPQVWLDCQVTERDHGVLLNWDVVAELFPVGLVEDMFVGYVRTLAWLVSPDGDWDRPLPDLLPARTREVRRVANATAGPLRERGLHEDFFAAAARDPDRLALAWGHAGKRSYGELAALADRLAAELQTRGLAGGESVAVTLPKGPDQVTAVLGVLRAGGVYVPVGIDQPARRQERIHAVAGVRFVVASPDFAPPEGTDLVVLPDQAPARPVEPVRVDPSMAAYLLFTSGSTGEPKAVEVPHVAAVNTIDAVGALFGTGRDMRVLAVSALDFDLSVFDIFGPLSVGGAVVLIDEAARRDARQWVELALRWRVTVWQSVPALLDMLLVAASADGADLPLRLALLGGDWVGLDLAARLADRAPGARLMALGGATETAIHSTVQPVPVPPPADWRSVPYGRPLRNQCLRVVDPHGRDRPDWVPGELWIGGRSVALGYRGDRERSARQFVTHDGVRWYRTGDLARFWPVGTVEFLGRTDFQVKIRGHRVELGEIEAALTDHPAVTRAVAVPVGHGPGRRLAAAVTTTGSTPDVEALLALLAERLPAYMVPAQVVVLDAVPLSGNGKIDRAAVARLFDRVAPEQAHDPPRGPLECAVAEIWCRLLDVPAVGRDQSFFALGGDSLTATRMLVELRSAGLVGADLRTLFDTPVLADVAAALRRDVAAVPGPQLVPDPAGRNDPFPATDVQRAYWMGRTDDFALGGVGSHWYWEFDGVDVDTDRLMLAVDRLVIRHDMLRAVFQADGRQRVLAEVPRFEIPEGHGTAALGVLRDTLSRRVPDPTRWPLMAIRAVRYGKRRTRIGFSVDYIVLDALSIVVFFAELATLYRDPDAFLPPVTVSFRDYVLGAGPTPDELAAAERHWLDRIDGLPAAPRLPLAADPGRITSPTFHRRADCLSAAEWQALTVRARAHDLTPAAVLAAAYAEVLAVWSEQDALTLNLTMFNRRAVHPDIDRVLGDFTSLLLVAYEPVPGESWLSTVRRFQGQVWEGMEHGAVSAIWVLRQMARRARVPAVSMPVVFTSALGVAADLVDMAFPFGEQVWGISQTPQVWLDNQVMERDGGLAFNWDSVDDLFPAGLVDAMFDGYHRLLRWLCSAEWTGPVPDLLPARQRAVRAAVNATAGPLPLAALHEPFFTVAAHEPERTALVWGADSTMTYGALAADALRIAGALRERGLRPAEPVAVTLPSGPEQIAAVLGVLAAGGSYVPVGVDQPGVRRDRILAKAGVRLAVTRVDAAGMDRLSPDVPATPLPGPLPAAPDTLAYTIFTSGSTGEPKGVEIAHQAAANTVTDINERFGVGADDRVLAVSALDFDLSVYDIFGLLSVGGALVLVDDSDRREARRWTELVDRWRVTVWNSVPALLEMLLVAAGPGRLTGLRVVLASGDWVGLGLPGALAAAAPNARFVALGGATEAAIWSNAFEVRDVPDRWRSIPYGRPLRNQCYRVVDPRGRDRPDWVAGELCIGGAGVALGYRNDPDVTARRFVQVAGERWYRTGDLGRYWPDGTLEFLGRVDFQVKIGGNRIELGEIEAAAQHHDLVDRAVAFTVGEGGARSLALAVVAGGEPPDAEGMRAHLAQRLPAYMVPGQVILADRLPLTANGKVDRRRLADTVGAVGGAGEDETPVGGTETMLAALWAELLGLDRVGRRQSFFALGGDSLVATRMIEALRRSRGITLTLRQLFAATTVTELATVVATECGAPHDEDDEEGAL